MVWPQPSGASPVRYNGSPKEGLMRLRFKWFDGRGWNHEPIIDEETGNEVGFVRSNGAGNWGGIDISLFNGKYRATAHSHQETVGFVSGIEAVLNHLVWVPPSPDKRASGAA